MIIQDLLRRLAERNVGLSVDGGELVVRAPRGALDAPLVALLREHKPAVLEQVKAGAYPPAGGAAPKLLELDAAEAALVAAGVDGGADNVQDVYPLGPLQEGILFHHLLAREGDPYLLFHMFALDSRERVDAFVAGLERVIGRHDILRTAVVWEGVREPVQVVWKAARLTVREVELDPAGGDAAGQLRARFGPRSYRLEVRRAPMVEVHVAHDAANGRWLLLMLRHHLTSDHMTVETLVREVRAYMRGEAGDLPAPVPFRNFVAQTRTGVRRDAHEAFFREMLGDVDEPTAPFGLLDAMGDDVQNEAKIDLDRALVARMTARARALRLSLASLCHLAWAMVLERVSGRGDVVFGTVLFGRMQAGGGADRAMGPFINTLPVRVRVDGDSVEAGVRRMHTLLVDLMQHEHASLALAQRCSRVRAPAPLFSSLLNYRHSAKVPSAETGPEWPGVQLVQARTGTSFPLMLSVDEMAERFVISVKVDRVADAGRVCALMRAALERIVEALETAPETPLDRLDVLPGAERRQVVEGWNATDREYPAGDCLHERIEAQVARTPDAAALTVEGETLTYAELNARANRLAHHLRTLGVGPDVRVALCVERSAEMVVGLLGVLKSGGAYVPLDPSNPADRLRFMLEDSAPAVVLTQAHLADLLDGIDVPVLALDRDASIWSNQSSENPDRGGLTPDHLAYMIYTSGSTGMPKGAMNAHRGVINRLFWMQEMYGLTSDDAVLQKTPYSFDVSVWEFFWPLLMGSRLVMARPDGHKDPGYLVDTIRDERITTVHFVPSMLQVFLEHPELDGAAALRRVVCSGEALPPVVAQRFHARLPGTELHNLYGPTEAAVDVTAWQCLPGASGMIPIGRPMANTRMYVLDESGDPVPVGVAGELYIAGIQVGRGYLGRPALTAEKFVADPFSATPGARMYRTGDLGRWLSDGSIEYLGRTDFQVKVRGHRIELGEIEARLAEHPSVRDAVVVAREDAGGEKRLVAYCVGGDELDVAALRAHLGQTLPEYMVPAAYVRLDALPLSANGKLDRKALPAPEGAAYGTRAYEAPVGEVEEALAEIWADVLGAPRVGRWDHFFETGGHSLLAIQVISRVKRVLGADVALSDVFDRPVLAELARKVEGSVRAALPPIEPVDRGGPLPLSFAQARLWFLEEMGGLGPAYHISRRLRLTGTLDRGALRRALDRVVARHEALRTTFAQVDRTPVQRISAEGGFALPEHDLRSESDADAALRRLVAEEAKAPFDLAAGPLVRGRLIETAEDDHVLLLTMHHIVSDGWSMGVLVRELGALYAAFARGEGDPLAPLPVQYADYAAWQRKWIGGEALEAQGAYWRDAFAGAPELLELPTDRPRPARVDYAGAGLLMSLDEELTAALKALSRRNGTTLYMTLLAGWAAVLGRLSGQSDVVIGTPTANRGRTEVEGLIGFFINTLAVRVDLSGRPTVAELLARVKARALAAQQNGDLPFEQVVERVQPARSLAHHPLFQVMFTWQNAPAGALELPGLTVGGVAAPEHETAKFDLSLSLREAEGRIVGGITYATALFDRATVERYAGYFARALREMAGGDRRAVDRLPLVSAEERRTLVETWNATEAAYPAGACVHQLFEAQAARTPDAVAVVADEVALTYAELNARANRLAHHLRSLGVGPDARVAICLERGLELMVGVLAVLKAGGAYVPLDPTYPLDRLRFMLADSAPVAVLTQETLGDELPGLFAGLAAPVLLLDAPAPAWAGEATSDPASDGLTVHHLAYLIYTSGSTGRPKGVMVPHGGLTHYVWWSKGRYADDEPRAFPLYSSVAFDLTVTSIFVPLIAGGRVVIYGEEAGGNPAVLRVVEDDAVDVAKVTPSHLVLLEGRDLRGGRLGGLIVGGEDLKAPLSQSVVMASGGRIAIYNEYGPTETVVGCMIHRFDPEADRGGSVPIGRAIANTKVYVLDAHGEPVPTGAVGELYVGGAQVTRGYLGRPDLTAERFVADPFSKDSGARMYRTGDLARWRADGVMEFLGRNDEQVKVRGFRIELGEIEARLADHAGVREAVVVAREDTPGDRRLVAYVAGGEQLSIESLRAHLSERLPEYMVPAAYVKLDALPLTPNGKVDRKALPAPEGEAYARRGYEAPSGDAEAALAEIWADVLGVDRVGRWDHFFEMGGHSLLAVQVVSRVREVMAVEAALGDVFARPVLADFAAGLETARRAELPPIERADRGGPLALSFAQARLWFLEEMGGLGPAYHVPRRLRMTGALDRDALRRALDRVVARHEALRTTFQPVDGSPAQWIAPEDAGFALAEHDLSADAAADATLRALMAEEAKAPFDLAAGPLIRGRLIRMAEDDHVLLLTMHHIVSDGWSMGVLVRELGALYAAFHAGRPDPLAPLPLQYADYAAWQRTWIEGPVLEAQGAYWRETLSGAPELLELPADRPRPAQVDHAGAVIAVGLDEALSAGLKALSRRHGTTLFMTLLAGWAVVLGRLSRQGDVVIGTPTANRGRTEIEGLIGFFLNTLAVRVDFADAPTVAGLLARVKARTLGAQASQDLPFEQVVELLQPARSLAHHPLFQVMFAWQNAPAGSLELPGLAVGTVAGQAQETAKFDLSLSLQEADGRISGGLTYATALFDRATAERYAGYLVRVLEQMAADDRVSVDRLSLLPDAELRDAVETWNATEAAYPADRCIHQLFEAQVDRDPHAIAVVAEDATLTYAELNARANRVAHHLRSLGVGPDARVAVCVERGAEMVAGLLGVMKAGGAYVPLDPSHPADRLRLVLEDSAPLAVLTQPRVRADLAGLFDGLAAPVVDLGAITSADSESAANLDADGVGVTPADPAYVMFTSGSTGRPKGVVVPHRGVVNLLWSIRGTVDVEAADRVLAVTTYAFDISVLELFLPLVTGARTVVLGHAQSGDPAALAAAIGEHGPTVMQATPATWRMLVEAGWEGAPALRALCGGEALPADFAAALKTRVGALWNVYGPTETSIWSAVEPVDGTDFHGQVPIGRPVANTRIYVLDPNGQPVPAGALGEIHIGGHGVARGYLGRPELTAEKFVVDPFSAEPEARMYRTGDLGRRLADGRLVFAGRTDFQVKVRGYRIELGEIEARLAEHPDVREAVVAAREDGQGGHRLVAYLVSPAGVEVDALRAHLLARLPEYMVPAAYVRLDAFPLNANGKVDRKALPAPEDDAFGRKAYEAPEGEVETALAEIWRELLKVETVGRHDHFFTLGGHSLLAVRLIERMRRRGFRLGVRALFTTASLAELAATVARDEAEDAASPASEEDHSLMLTI